MREGKRQRGREKIQLRGVLVPMPHCAQAVLPFSSLYSPAWQIKHGPPSSPEYPALHLQSVAVVDPIVESELGVQGRQKDDSVAPTNDE